MKERRWLIIFFSVVFLIIAVTFSFILPPRNFPTNLVIDIPTGSTTSQIADLLYQNKIIRSTKIFELVVLRQEVAEHLKAGFYQFEKPLIIGQVVRRLTEGLFANNPVKFTVPEGLSVEQLAVLTEQNFSGINQTSFLLAASSSAGFLFPDTYLLPSQLKSEQLVKLMRANFDERIEELKPKINQAGHSLEKNIKMAALVEEEAKTKIDRRIIAGILWKRFDVEMKLEVDVATSTYQTVGFPPTPIVSPGLESIEAALSPEITPYWFYLSDKQGKMHYARTFAEHQNNIARYLK
jgi:UPF0755 protein